MKVTAPPHPNHKILWDSKRSVCIKIPRKPWLSNWSIVDFRPISTCAFFFQKSGYPITYNINRSLRHATSHQIALSLKRRSYKWFKVKKKTWFVICFFPLNMAKFQQDFPYLQLPSPRISCAPVTFGPIADGRHGRRSCGIAVLLDRRLCRVLLHSRLSGLRCGLRCQKPFVFLLNPLRGLLTAGKREKACWSRDHVFGRPRF